MKLTQRAVTGAVFIVAALAPALAERERYARIVKITGVRED